MSATRRRIISFWSILIILIVFGIELTSGIVAVHFLAPYKQYLWRPNLDAVRAAWRASGTAVDEEIGWPPPSDAIKPPRDVTGAKYNSDFPESSDACISAYGDSFIWGDEVPLTDGWIEQLSRQLDCRVSNYGVGGYGTDQAFVRFRRMQNDNAPIALLGIFPENVVRNVNQYRGFLGYGPEPFWVKGRFVLNEAGRLEWISRPPLDGDGFIHLHRTPALFLPREYLLPDTRDGPVSVRFPYSVTIGRFILAPWLWARLNGRTPYDDFFRADHPSGALALTIAIAEAFVHEAERRNKKAFVVMQPSAGSFRMRARFGTPDYAPLIYAMVTRGIDVFDPGPALLTALNGRSYCELFTQPTHCQGHFSIAGGGLVAKVIGAELRRRGLIN